MVVKLYFVKYLQGVWRNLQTPCRFSYQKWVNTKIISTMYLLIFCLLTITAQPVMTSDDKRYTYETDSLVLQKIDEWQDLKFGILIQWGPYSIWGAVESWSICSEDEEWCERPPGKSYVEYVKEYEMLPQYFNPVQFDPDKWAKVTKEAGMKYVVFTTKHHDGFCMYDSKYTNYKITDPSVPFNVNPKANIAKEVFQSFRNEGMAVGAYYSKPDWHHPDYWAPEWATPDRHVNYDTQRYPERWQRFKDFTYNQFEELMTGYGKIDILWLDGGWVQPKWKNQGIDMERIVKMARGHQPGLIVVDRSVGGIFENYLTPEKRIPDKPLPYPWETCMPSAKMWSFKPNDEYKPARQIIHMLVDIVAKGGNYLLNFGPGPDGNFDRMAYQRLAEIGQWMKINGEAIYSTRPIDPYKQDKVCYTSKKDGTLYGIYLADEGEIVPSSILMKGITVSKRSKVSMLGVSGNCIWKQTDEGVLVTVPTTARKTFLSSYAWTLKISQ